MNLYAAALTSTRSLMDGLTETKTQVIIFPAENDGLAHSHAVEQWRKTYPEGTTANISVAKASDDLVLSVCRHCMRLEEAAQAYRAAALNKEQS